MIITRRSFLAGVAAAAATRAFPAAKPAVDPDLVVLLSDVHVNGVPGRDAFQRDKFARVVADVLRMDPLPANAVFFGDLAWHHGRELDYRASLGGIRLLEDAGVKVTLGMGNHDRRWYKTLVRKNWKESPQIRTLCLPSTGHWGDIGYVTMRLSADRAVASLRQYEYFFPRPKPDDPKYVEVWRDITEENQNQSCTFRLPSIA